MTFLVTGGAGYIGSHTVVELLNSNQDVVIVDNLCNSSIKVLDRIETICKQRPTFYQLDVSDMVGLNKVFANHQISAVIHFAALKAVGESVKLPFEYYQNNVAGSMILFDVMRKNNVKTIVFSSSATVYGDPATTPITEDFPLSATNPYGWSKLMIEQILRDIYKADNSWSIAILRYFNPIGAHTSGFIGENPRGVPNNLMPYITQVAIGKREYLTIYGNDYSTHDGTGVRDYIHVTDLAIGHLKALDHLKCNAYEMLTVNLGTGVGYSVLDMVKAFEIISGRKINYKIARRRSGDIAKCYANPQLAADKLGFKTHLDINDMCRDSWNWQNKNPNGYE